jgi:serine/threonine protein kinase
VASEVSPASGPQRLGAYQLVAPLATGGMAELFVAKTAGVSGFEKHVALKVIHPNFSSDPEFVRMLIDEAKLAVQLQHANIVQTYDLGVVDGRYYIAMELIDGADLYKVLRTASERGRDFPIDVAAFITSEVATGLDYAHRKNDPLGRPLQIVHRDVSPQNVLVSREGEIKIVDFGIAKAALRGQETQAGVIKGKYFYMSPEHAGGDRVDARADVFSTGILLYEMLVGDMLYRAQDLERLLKLVRAADVQPPSRKRLSVPPELDAIVMKALAKRPQDRFQNAADLATALTRFMRTAYPDFGRVHAARFVREVLEAEPSHAQITLPTLPHIITRDDLGDENSLLYDLRQGRRVEPEDTPRPHTPDQSSLGEATHGDPHRPNRPSDYEDAGATEVEPRALLGIRENTEPDLTQISPLSSRGFSVDDEREQTELALEDSQLHPSLGRGVDLEEHGFDIGEEESTRNRSSFPRPGAVAPTPAPAPAPRPPWPPRASPPPLGPGMGLGVSELLRGAQPPSSPRRPDDPGGDDGALVVSTSYAPSDSNLRLSWLSRITELKRRKLLILAGLFLLGALVVLAVALLSPDGPPRGSIEVVSSPAGATVRIDGTMLSELTPTRVTNVEVRQPHRLNVSLRGYDTWESEARFEAGSHELRLQAILVPAVGTLIVGTVPAGAEAIVNGRISGNTPINVRDLPVNEDVVLELRLRGYKVATRALRWNGKRAITVNVPLEKAR